VQFFGWVLEEIFSLVQVILWMNYLFCMCLQIVHQSRILKIRVRGTKKDLMQETSSEEICIVLPGVIARFDGSNIQSMVQKWVQEKNSNFWDQKNRKGDAEDTGSLYQRLPYQIWNVNKNGVCVDATVTGVMPPPLLELQVRLVMSI
jgi:hypothetical protein